MKIKMIEIRDSATCIAAMAISMQAADLVEYRFLRRCGYPSDGTSVMLMCLDDGKATNDPYGWPELGMGPRTMTVAHDWILANWERVTGCSVYPR